MFCHANRAWIQRKWKIQLATTCWTHWCQLDYCGLRWLAWRFTTWHCDRWFESRFRLCMSQRPKCIENAPSDATRDLIPELHSRIDSVIAASDTGRERCSVPETLVTQANESTVERITQAIETSRSRAWSFTAANVTSCRKAKTRCVPNPTEPTLKHVCKRPSSVVKIEDDNAIETKPERSFSALSGSK